MRDQMDSEIWNANHDQFTKYLGVAFAGAGDRLRRAIAPAGPLPAQLIAGLFAVSLTLATFGASYA